MVEHSSNTGEVNGSSSNMYSVPDASTSTSISSSSDSYNSSNQSQHHHPGIPSVNTSTSMESQLSTNYQPTHEGNINNGHPDGTAGSSIETDSNCLETALHDSSSFNSSSNIERTAIPSTLSTSEVSKSSWDVYCKSVTCTTNGSESISTTTISDAMQSDAPSLEVISRCDGEAMVAENQESLIDMASSVLSNLSDTRWTLSAELSPQSSFDIAGPSMTTTTLFATTLASCDTDVVKKFGCDDVVHTANSEHTPLATSQEVSPDSASLERQIQLAEAMFAKSAGPEEIAQDDCKSQETVVATQPLQHGCDEPSDEFYERNSVSVGIEHKASSVTTPLRSTPEMKCENIVDQNPSISNFGQTIASHNDPIPNKAKQLNTRDEEKTPESSNNVKKVRHTTPAINNDIKLKDAAALSKVSEESALSAVTLEYPNPTVNVDVQGMTERVMKKIDGTRPGPSMYAIFKQHENDWAKVKQQSRLKTTLSSQNLSALHQPTSSFVTSDAALGNPKCWTKLREQYNKGLLDYDIAFYGDTKGLFLAHALLLLNPSIRVCVIKSEAKSDNVDQEWYASSTEFDELVKAGLLTENDANDIIVARLPTGRFGFQVRTVHIYM